MRRTPVLCLIASILAGGSASGHGGQYRPPTPQGPLTGVGEKDSYKFGAGSGQTPPELLNVGPLVRKGRAAGDDSGFALWWKHNAARLIDLRGRGRAQSAQAQHDRVAKELAADWKPVREALFAALEENDGDIVDSALLAIGRSSTKASADESFQAIWPFVGYPNVTIRQSAVLAAALTGSAKALPVLSALARGNGRLDMQTDAVTMLSLGLLSIPQARATLVNAIEGAAPLQIQQAAVVALGLYQVDRREIVADLLARLAKVPQRSPLAPLMIQALARLGEDAEPAVPRLLELTAPAYPRELRRPSLIALGRLGRAEDAAVVEALRRAARSDSDPPTRGLAYVALAEIAARAPQDTAIADALLAAATACPFQSDAPWAAIALGIALRGRPADGEPRGRADAALLHALKDPKAEKRGAAALALGLLGASAAIEPLRALLDAKESQGNDVQRRAALALGMLGDRESLTPLRALLRAETDDERRADYATALALIDAAAATELLLQQLEQAKTVNELAFLAPALGRIGVTAALPALVKRARDPAMPGLARAYALIGIGRLLEPTDLPWNARFEEAADPLAACEAEALALDLY